MLFVAFIVEIWSYPSWIMKPWRPCDLRFALMWDPPLLHPLSFLRISQNLILIEVDKHHHCIKHISHIYINQTFVWTQKGGKFDHLKVIDRWSLIFFFFFCCSSFLLFFTISFSSIWSLFFSFGWKELPNKRCKEDSIGIHERMLKVNTKDYAGSYDPAPTFRKPPFKLIPNWCSIPYASRVPTPLLFQGT